MPKAFPSGEGGPPKAVDEVPSLQRPPHPPLRSPFPRGEGFIFVAPAPNHAKVGASLHVLGLFQELFIKI